MAIEMNGHDSPDGPIGPQSRIDLIEIKSATLIDITPHRLGTGANDRERGREGRQGSGQNPRPRQYSGAAKRDLKSIQAARYPHGVVHPPPPGKLLLERAHLLAEYKPTALTNAINRLDRVGSNVAPLPREVVGSYPRL